MNHAHPPGLARFDLSGRTALVTGSSQGIGFALAAALGSAGARLVLNGRDTAKLERARSALAERGLTRSCATQRGQRPCLQALP